MGSAHTRPSPGRQPGIAIPVITRIKRNALSRPFAAYMLALYSTVPMTSHPRQQHFSRHPPELHVVVEIHVQCPTRIHKKLLIIMRYSNCFYSAIFLLINGHLDNNNLNYWKYRIKQRPNPCPTPV